MNETQPLPTAYRFRTEAKARAEMTKWADALIPAEGSKWAEVSLYKFAGQAGWWILNEAANTLLGEADPQGVIEYAADYDEYLGDNLGTDYEPPAEARADIEPLAADIRRRAAVITDRWAREEEAAAAAYAVWQAGGQWVEPEGEAA